MTNAEKVLTELLRLYDWRFQIAKREEIADSPFVSDQFVAETQRQLRLYGVEKKNAWMAAREVLKDVK